MSYEEKLALVKVSLIKDYKKRISNNWEKMFDMWLSCDADLEFGEVYVNNFKEHFSKYMSKDLESRLWQSAGNVLYAICSFQQYFSKANLDNVLDYVELFLENQFDNFTNEYDDIQMAMYDEAHPETASPSTN